MLKALNCFSEHERMDFDLQLIVELVRWMEVKQLQVNSIVLGVLLNV